MKIHVSVLLGQRNEEFTKTSLQTFTTATNIQELNEEEGVLTSMLESVEGVEEELLWTWSPTESPTNFLTAPTDSPVPSPSPSMTPTS